MATPILSNLLLTEEEYSILTRANASFSGKIEKCFNVSFSSSERELCQSRRAACADFSPSDPDSMVAPDLRAKENELNSTKGRLDVLDISVWSGAVNRFKLTGSINNDVRRCVTLLFPCIISPFSPALLHEPRACSDTLRCAQALQPGDADYCVAQDVRNVKFYSR